MKTSGLGAIPPQTICEIFKHNADKFGNLPALSTKVKGKWHTINYREYYE